MKNPAAKKKRNLAVAIILSVFAIIILTIAALNIFWLDPYLKDLIQTKIQTACPRCKISIGTVTTYLFKSKFEISDVVFADSPRDITTFDFHLKNLAIEINPWSLRDDLPEIPKIEVVGLELTATDDALKAKTTSAPFDKTDDDRLAKLPPMKILSVVLRHCAFTYAARGVDKRRAHLGVYDIDGELKPIITRKSERADIAGHIHASFEKSGDVHIDLRIQPFLRDHEDHIDIAIDHQDVSRLNPMFDTEDGVRMEGIVDHFKTEMIVQHAHLSGTAKIAYHGLKLDIKKTADRGALESAVAQLIQKMIVISERPVDANDDPLVKMDKAREPHQSIFNFLLSGLKPALVELITKKNQDSLASEKK